MTNISNPNNLTIIPGDLLTINKGIIAHQVNCRGVMGTGLAKAIRAQYPQVYQTYNKLCPFLPLQLTSNHPRNKILGAVQLVEIIPQQLYVANIFGQLNYGRMQRHTNYNALALALAELEAQEFSRSVSVLGLDNNPAMQATLANLAIAQQQTGAFPVYLPYKMGCNNAGGDWNVVSQLIDTYCPSAIVVYPTQS